MEVAKSDGFRPRAFPIVTDDGARCQSGLRSVFPGAHCLRFGSHGSDPIRSRRSCASRRAARIMRQVVRHAPFSRSCCSPFPPVALRSRFAPPPPASVLRSQPAQGSGICSLGIRPGARSRAWRSAEQSLSSRRATRTCPSTTACASEAAWLCVNFPSANAPCADTDARSSVDSV